MIARSLLWLIAAYQRWISPASLPACRFHPSCSEYAAQAIALHGSLAGTWFAIGRLLRCHPFSSGGFDPVPLDPSTTTSSNFSALGHCCEPQHPARDGRKH